MWCEKYEIDYEMTIYKNLPGNMISYTFYLSNHDGANKLTNLTDLSLNEIESIVGRFKESHKKAGKLKGEVVVYFDGLIRIRHHFTKKVLWENR
jgi:hypothetical protein